MKKTFTFISILIAFCMAFTLISFADDPSGSLNNFKSNTTTYKTGQFKDVGTSSWYYGNVKRSYEMNLVKGTSENTFNPDGNITIAETLALACRLNDIYYGGSGKFVQGNPWYQVYVNYAIGNEIIRSGVYSNYNATATRSQFAAIMAKALPASALPAINNVTQLPDVSRSAVNASAIYSLYNAGILTGNDEYGTFYPNSNIKRSEVSAIVTRMADKSLRKNITLSIKGNYAVDYLGKTIGEARTQYGNGSPYMFTRYLDGAVGCLYFDECKMLFVPENYSNCYTLNPSDNVKIRAVIAFGFIEASPGLCANMTYNEIVQATGLNPGYTYSPDEGGDTDEIYFTEFTLNGVRYNYGWTKNVNEQASSLWLSKYQ